MNRELRDSLVPDHATVRDSAVEYRGRIIDVVDDDLVLASTGGVGLPEGFTLRGTRGWKTSILSPPPMRISLRNSTATQIKSTPRFLR